MKKFLDEFKQFAIQGNVIDMAIGIIIGTGFNAIVQSLVKDIISPIAGILLSNVDFSDLKIILGGTGDNLITLNYGLFIQNVVNFIIVALVAFFIVKTMNRIKTLKNKEEEKKEKDIEISDELKELQKISQLLSNINENCNKTSFSDR